MLLKSILIISLATATFALKTPVGDLKCNYNGKYSNGRCTCFTGHYGEFCQTFCNEASTCNGRGSCNQWGTCSCNDGTGGYFCETLCDCGGSDCYANGVCICAWNRYGDKCEKVRCEALYDELTCINTNECSFCSSDRKCRNTNSTDLPSDCKRFSLSENDAVISIYQKKNLIISGSVLCGSLLIIAIIAIVVGRSKSENGFGPKSEKVYMEMPDLAQGERVVIDVSSGRDV
eukprot:TRINITY_DN338_c0_g1_i1.p1 TRINITY_DN338_c0_g1~~TRINITY_DN338_c0_g1_i1.p1  ORF type:complete len:232 (-),score=39.96 TRINITY_DN338_c0_g1_i1:39-734(-)